MTGLAPTPKIHPIEPTPDGAPPMNGPLARILALAIASAAPDGPRPPVAWPAGPMEVRVAFPRPVGPDLSAKLVGQAIDLTEPGQSALGGHINIAAARLADDGRTLILATDPHSRPGTYTLRLPSFAPIAYDLSGVLATWDDALDSPTWWPSPDTNALRALAERSPEHARALARLASPGKLTLTTLVDLPPGRPTLRLESNGPVHEATVGGEAFDLANPARIEARPEPIGEPLDLALTVSSGSSPLSLRVTLRPDEATPESPLAASRTHLPWAPATPTAAPPDEPPPFALNGGDPNRGEAIYLGKEANCATCHRRNGKGGEVGPSLDHLTGADPAAVYRDIDRPSVLIRPDYVPYTVALKSGQVLSGIVRADGADALRVLDAEAHSTRVPLADVDELRPATTSLMPVGLAGALGEAKMRDLLAYLTAKAGRETSAKASDRNSGEGVASPRKK